MSQRHLIGLHLLSTCSAAVAMTASARAADTGYESLNLTSMDAGFGDYGHTAAGSGRRDVRQIDNGHAKIAGIACVNKGINSSGAGGHADKQVQTDPAMQTTDSPPTSRPTADDLDRGDVVDQTGS